MPDLLARDALQGARQYVRDLERAYRRSDLVGDPDYALAQDPDVYDVILRDPETRHAIDYRRHLGAGTRWRVVPASDAPDDRRAAAWCEEALGQLRGFTAARVQLLHAVFRGQTWAAIVGRRQRGVLAGLPGDWWVPTALVDVDKRRFQAFVGADRRLDWALYSLARHAWEPLGERRRWFVRLAHDVAESNLRQGSGLVEALYHWQYAKARVLAEGLAGVERWAQGIVHASVDGLGRAGSPTRDVQDAADAWLTAIEAMRSRHALVHDRVDQLEMIDGPKEGHKMVTEFLAYLASGIRVLCLGANLPTEATEGGSYALARVQENSTEALVQHDRELLGEAITHDLLGLVWAQNRGVLSAAGLARARAPSFEIVHEKRRDPNAAASAVATLLAAGVEGLREDEVFEAVGYTPAGPNDRPLRVVPRAQGSPPAAAE